MTRTCFRCGEGFITEKGRPYLCEKCKVLSQPIKRDNKKVTPRERQLITCVSKGWSNKEIAARLHLSEGTIKGYMYRIFIKVGVKSRTELALHAIR